VNLPGGSTDIMGWLDSACVFESAAVETSQPSSFVGRQNVGLEGSALRHYFKGVI